MNTSMLISLSSNALYAAFILYLIATFFFGATIRDKHSQSKKGKAGIIGFIITILGFLSHIVYFVSRWIAGGHAPLTNMYEYTTFFSLTLVLGFLIIYFIYRTGVLGVFALPIALIIIAYASVFPSDVAPLAATLKSHWLYIHVGTVSLGQGLLSMSFIVGLIYLIGQIDQAKASKKTRWLETIIIAIFIYLGFSLVSFGFGALNYETVIQHPHDEQVVETTYVMPAIAGPNEGIQLTEDTMEPWFEVPSWMHGSEAGKKFNSLVWSVIAGSVIYIIIRLIARKRVAALLQPLMRKVKPDLLDEISYRSVAIGFPVFTLGGLIFAAIYAQIAWDRFWGWDPKEVWALITWFFYAAYLHLRLSRGWHGERSAWLAVIGFGIIMFNLIAVNLILAGLHSYAS